MMNIMCRSTELLRASVHKFVNFFFSPIPYDVLASGSSDEAIVLPISAALHPISTQKRDTFAAALSTISRSEKIRSPVPMTPPTKPLIKSFVVKCTS